MTVARSRPVRFLLEQPQPIGPHALEAVGRGLGAKRPGTKNGTTGLARPHLRPRDLHFALDGDRAGNHRIGAVAEAHVADGDDGRLDVRAAVALENGLLAHGDSCVVRRRAQKNPKPLLASGCGWWCAFRLPRSCPSQWLGKRIREIAVGLHLAQAYTRSRRSGRGRLCNSAHDVML